MWSNGYKVYNAPAGKTSTEAHAGVSIIIDESLLQSTRVTQTIIHDHRIMVVRLHNINYDIAILAAYAPGEHTNVQERSKFWTLLKNYLTKLPKNTHTFIGIDANGHIGRDTQNPM